MIYLNSNEKGRNYDHGFPQNFVAWRVTCDTAHFPPLPFLTIPMLGKTKNT